MSYKITMLTDGSVHSFILEKAVDHVRENLENGIYYFFYDSNKRTISSVRVSNNCTFVWEKLD